MVENQTLVDLARNLRARRAALIAAGLLALAALLAYANSWSVPFLFDDTVTIVDNPSIREAWSRQSVLSPAAYTGVGGRPVANLSLIFNYAVGGFAVRGYHGVNLAIHYLAALALFGLVRRTLFQPALALRFGGDAWWIALAVAGLWLLHPVQTQSVTYISQRTESLMGLFYFITLYCFLRGVQTQGRPGWLALSVASCFAGVASKEVMVTAPVMVFLYDYAFVAGSVGAAWRRRWGYYLGLGGSWVLLALLMRGLGGRGVGFGLGLEWWRYLVTGCRAMAGYLSLSVWPHPLVFDYGSDFGAASAAEYLGCGLVLGLGGLAVYGLWRSPPLGFLVAWFLLTLAPTSSVVPIPLQPIAENRVYLPLAAVVVALVLATCVVARRAGRFAWLAVAVAWGALTLARNADYRSEVAIWSDTVAKRPANSRAHHNLGNALRDAGRPVDAEREFMETLRLKPDYAEAEAALGGVLGQLGRLDEVIEHCRKALRIDPNTVSAYNNLGGALWRKGDLPGAIAAYEAAVLLRPGFAEAQANLAGVLLRVGRMADAVTASAAALRVKPGLRDAQFAHGCGLAGLGRLAEAVEVFHGIVRTQPDHIDARYNLATTLLQLGRTAEAIPAYKEVLRQNPTHAAAHSNLASALLAVGRTAEAIAHAETAVRLNPDFHDAHLNLGLALRRSGRHAEAATQFEAALLASPNSKVAREQLEELRASAPSNR